MKTLINRVEKLENHVGGDGKSAELYDCDGQRILDAKVVRFPTETRSGEAILSDGTYKTIAQASIFTLEDVIKRARERKREGHNTEHRTDQERQAVKEAYREKYKDALFLRPGGYMSFIELMLTVNRGRESVGDSDAVQATGL